jgi:hypothetical protein
MKVKAKKVADVLAQAKYMRNTLSEKGQELFDKLVEVVEGMIDDAEVEYTEDELKETILKIVNANEEVPTAVAEAIATKIKNMTSAVKKLEVSDSVKNEIARTILTTKKADVRNAVQEIAVKNGITGYSFDEVTDFAISEAWGNEDGLFSQLYKTPVSKFFYNADDLTTAAILAKQWDKTGESEKAIQELAVTGKTITTRYIYKRQQVAQEDIDDMDAQGALAGFLRWLNEELDRQIVNTIIMAILVGDTINAAGNRVTTFETIGNKTVSDVFTTVGTAANSGVVTLSDFRAIADSVKNPYGKKKVAVMPTTVLSELAKFIYGNGGTETFLDKDVVAKAIGVDEIYTTDIIDAVNGTIWGLVFIPAGYWVKEKNTISVVYPTYEKNVLNYQKERNIGGAIHDLYSSAVLIKA